LLWLVKWILIIPHVVVLIFLWIAFFFTSIVAFFAILFTRHYRRAIFEFNVGGCGGGGESATTAYSALGTDKYRRSRWPTTPTSRRTSPCPTRAPLPGAGPGQVVAARAAASSSSHPGRRGTAFASNSDTQNYS